MQPESSARERRFVSRLLEEQVFFAFMLWAGFFLVVTVLTFVVSRFTEIESSGWAQAGPQVPQWFTMFVGGYVVYNLMPINIAHGLTRRQFARGAVVAVVLYAAALAVMVTAGFLIERGVYAVMDWPQVLTDSNVNDHLFDTTRQYHLVFLESFLTLAVWTTVGGFGGAAFYRGEEGAFFLLPLGLIPLLLVAFGFSAMFGPFRPLKDELLSSSPEPVLAIAMSLLAFAIAVGLTWPLLRNLPVASKST